MQFQGIILWGSVLPIFPVLKKKRIEVNAPNKKIRKKKFWAK